MSSLMLIGCMARFVRRLGAIRGTIYPANYPIARSVFPFRACLVKAGRFYVGWMRRRMVLWGLLDNYKLYGLVSSFL